MGKIRIDRKAHHRGSYRRSDGTHVKGSNVDRSIYLAKDKGAKGRTPKSKQWFKPTGNLGGWSKDQSESERRRRASRGRSDLSSGRALGSLANVTTDRETRSKARADSRYFYSRLRK